MGKTGNADSHHDEQHQDRSLHNHHQQQEEEYIPEETVMYPPRNPAQHKPTQHAAPPPMVNRPTPQPQPYNQNPNGMPAYGQPVFTNGWSSGLFDCMNDPQNALVTLCFPCITFGEIAEVVDQGQSPCMTSGVLYLLLSFVILPFFYSCTYRAKIRVKYGLAEQSGPDCLVHFCCEHCALCQEYRELQAQGFDPSIGWMGNMQLQQQQGNMMPPPQQRM